MQQELQHSLLMRLENSLKGIQVVINPKEVYFDYNKPYAFDVETDELDNFVGFGLYCGEDTAFYFTELKYFDNKLKLIGHNIKSDLKWLKMWKIDVNPNNVVYDTMLASYCQNPTREKHGLKTLSSELLKNSYPDYKDIVGKGRNRVTLDKQPLEISSKYNANDVVATYQLYQYFNSKLTTQQRNLLMNVELPLMRLLLKMEQLGIKIDIKYLNTLKQDFDYAINQVLVNLDGKDINFNSPKQVKDWLKVLGIKLESTGKKNLYQIDHPKVKELLNYREYCKLQNTYVIPLMSSERCHTEFNQIINTGRLSSRNPNLQNIPTKTERGNQLRKAFIAKEKYVLLDFDYSQIEYRLLAHFTQEPILLNAYKEGKDIHEETAKLLNTSRYIGKTCNFAAIYGAQAKKIAQTVNSSQENTKITKEQAEEFLTLYWKKLPRVRQWIERIKDEARSKKSFRVLSGQHYPLTTIDSSDKLLRWHAERQAVNGTIQGSAAYIIKLSMLELEKYGYIPVLQIHDELIFEEQENSNGYDPSILTIKTIMENVVKLSVPLVVDYGIGKNWDEAKS